MPNEAGMTKRAGKLIDEFKDLVFPAGYEPGKKRVLIFLFKAVLAAIVHTELS